MCKVMGVESYRVLCLPLVLDDLVSFSNMLLQLFFKLTCLGAGDMDFLFVNFINRVCYPVLAVSFTRNFSWTLSIT